MICLLFFFFLFPSPSCFPPAGRGCFVPLTAFVKPLSLKHFSCKVRMVFVSLLLDCDSCWAAPWCSPEVVNVPVSKSYQCPWMLDSRLDLNIRLTSPILGTCSTALFIYCHFVLGFFCIDNVFGPSVDPVKAEELVPVFKHMIYTCEWLSDKKFRSSHGQVLLFSGQG